MRFLKVLLVVISITFTTSISLFAKEQRSSVAVVVDKTTYKTISQEIDNYIESINAQGKKGILVIDSCGTPEPIKTTLQKLWREQNLEGAILIGDIPIPMVRNANHLSTGFKMSPKRPWIESSIPSDRYYDDFNLKFTFLKRDSLNKSLFYYSLDADSPQKIDCTIYTSRIKPPKIEGMDKYQAIALYLKKAYNLKAKGAKELKKIFVFAGHGYNSESMNARIDEVGTLRSQFPSTWTTPGRAVDFVNFDYKPAIKFQLKEILADGSYGLAILHHHGSNDAQLISPLPKVASSIPLWRDAIKRYVRVKIANAKNPEKTKQNYIKEYGIPESWTETNPQLAKEDSTVYANTDLTIADMKGYKSNASVIILDACFNGAFIEDEYIAGRYIFNEGETMVVKANSVNTLQDTWTNELMGLLGAGVCVGNWAKGEMTLESHLYGDATYAFANDYPKYNIEEAMLSPKSNKKYWRTLLNSGITDFESLAIKRLAKNGEISEAELLEIEQNNPDPIVRLSAFMAIKRHSKGDLYKAIEIGMKDSYELLARLASLTAEVNGDPRLTSLVKEMDGNPTTSQRVKFHLIQMMESYVPSATTLEDFENLTTGKMSARDQRLTVTAQRNKCNPYAINQLFNLFKKSDNKEEKIQIVEVLGWYCYSYKRDEIAERCGKLMESEQDPEIKNELLRTINRLTNK